MLLIYSQNLMQRKMQILLFIYAVYDHLRTTLYECWCDLKPTSTCCSYLCTFNSNLLGWLHLANKLGTCLHVAPNKKKTSFLAQNFFCHFFTMIFRLTQVSLQCSSFTDCLSFTFFLNWLRSFFPFPSPRLSLSLSLFLSIFALLLLNLFLLAGNQTSSVILYKKRKDIRINFEKK